MAALICAGVELPALVVTALQALVTHCVRPAGGVQGFAVVSPYGRVAGSPAWLQSIARLGARMPLHDCPCEGAENNRNIEIRGKRKSRLIYLWPQTILCVVWRV